ncbi:MAG: GAF domain-containing protein [Leptolyngbya sp. IPPAS B-1204]
MATTDGQPMMEIRIPADRGIAGYVASTGQTLNISNAYEDPRFDPSVDQRTGYRTRTILCMPVFNSNKTLIGVTQLINKHQGCFNASDEEFMRAFNIQAGIALENAQLFERVLLEQQYQKTCCRASQTQSFPPICRATLSPLTMQHYCFWVGHRPKQKRCKART